VEPLLQIAAEIMSSLPTSIAEKPRYAWLPKHATCDSPHNRAIYIIGQSRLSRCSITRSAV